MTGRVLIFQHLDDDSAGRFGQFLAADGFRADTVMLHRGEAIPPLRGYDLMLVLGGSMDVWEEARYPWLVAEKKAIAEWVSTSSKALSRHLPRSSAVGKRLGRQRRARAGRRKWEFSK